jgi:WD40 repeat protein/serine/threonine protein kinase
MATDSSSDRDPVERLAEDYLERRRRGEDLSVDDYAEGHPDWADRIREAFPALLLIERLKPGSGDCTGSFDGAGVGYVLEAEGDGVRPARLGDYRIVREVGRGGMGVVYEAVQESLGRHVALKVLSSPGRIDSTNRERFRLEARSAARLHHTHIVPVYAVGEHDGVQYYAMQFIAGCGLDAVLDDLRRLRRPGAGPGAASAADPDGTATTADEADALSRVVARSLLTGTATVDAADPPAEAPPRGRSGEVSGLSAQGDQGYYRAVARLGIQIAEALTHAHAQGVLHRDIKPSNLLLDADGKAWVTDFGLAKVEGSDGPTRTGDIVGTLRYMAPERFDGWSDPRSDVYGLGVTLYELLTLRPAHDAVTRARLIEKVLHDLPAPPRKFDPRVPRDLETVVLKAIAREPAERYATARELGEDLENFLTGKPIRARRVGSLEQSWRWCRRNPAAAGLIGASGVAVLALTALAVGLSFNAALQRAHRLEKSAREREVSLNASLQLAYKDEQLARKNEATMRYLGDMLLAERAWSESYAGHAGQLLDSWAPGPGKPDLRNWEWYYLDRQRHSALKTLQVPGLHINALALSPDGSRVVTSAHGEAASRGLKVWDTQTGALVFALDGHTGRNGGVAYSPDGTLIASASGTSLIPGEVKLWDAKTGRVLRNIPSLIGDYGRVAFSPEGTRIAAVNGYLVNRRSLDVWDIKTGQALISRRDFEGDLPLCDLAFSPDGESLAVACGSTSLESDSDRSGAVKLLNARNGGEKLTLSAPRGPLTCVAFSPDGRLLAAAGWENVIWAWDLKARSIVRTMRGHTALIRGLAFSPDGGRLASASEDNSARIWDVETGQERLTLRGHALDVNGVAFSADGRQLATVSLDQTVRFWDAERGQEGVGWDAEALRDRSFQPNDQAWPRCAGFSPDGREVAISGTDRTVRAFDSFTGKLLRTYPRQDDAIWGISYSPDGKRIAAGIGHWHHPETPGEVKLWDASTGAVVWSRRAHAGVVRAVAFSPDGTRLATTGGEMNAEPGYIKVWDVKTGKDVMTLRGHSQGLVSLAYSADGRFLASGGWEPTVRVWDVETGRALRTLDASEFVVSWLSFTPDSARLAAGCNSGVVKFWDVKQGTELHQFRGHRSNIFSVAFSPDGTRLATGSDDRTVKLWDVATGREALTLRGHPAKISRVAFSPDGHRLVSAGSKGTVRIWDATPRNPSQPASERSAP